MDINMPIKDGVTASKEILNYYDNKSITPPIIIATTAYTDLKTKSDCYDIGMNYFITKPI